MAWLMILLALAAAAILFAIATWAVRRLANRIQQIRHAEAEGEVERLRLERQEQGGKLQDLKAMKQFLVNDIKTIQEKRRRLRDGGPEDQLTDD